MKISERMDVVSYSRSCVIWLLRDSISHCIRKRMCMKLFIFLAAVVVCGGCVGSKTANIKEHTGFNERMQMRQQSLARCGSTVRNNSTVVATGLYRDEMLHTFSGNIFVVYSEYEDDLEFVNFQHLNDSRFCRYVKKDSEGKIHFCCATVPVLGFY